MMRRTAFMLLALVVLAGCTSPLGGGEGDGDQERTGVEIDLSLTADEVFAGGMTQLIGQVQNYNPEPLTAFTVTLANAGDLASSGALTLAEGTEGDEVTVCTLEEVPAEGLSGPGIRECIWEIAPPDGFVGAGKDSVTLPLLLLMNYAGTVYSEGSALPVTFQDPEDITPGATASRSVTVENGDIRATMTHTAPVSTASGEVPVSISVANTGSGHIQGEVDIDFSGSLTDLSLDTGQSSCLPRVTLNFIRSQQTNTVECQFVVSSPGNLDDTDFTLRPEFTYTYRVSHELPLTIIDR